MTHAIDIEAIIQNAQEAVEPTLLEDGNLYAFRDSGGGVHLIRTPGYDEEATRAFYERGPSAIDRSVTVRDADSLVAYLANNLFDADEDALVGHRYMHGKGWLELWADIDRREIKAILDGGDGFREHTATLDLRHSREWEEWAKVDGRLFPQVEFAQFVEDHLTSIGAPDGADLLDVCQTLQATKSVDFKSSTILANGQRQFRYQEQIDGKAGAAGQLAIPAELTLVLRPFQGSEPVAIQARFRYQINGNGQLMLGVRLNEPERALEDAFAAVVEQIQRQVPVRVNHGIG